MLYRTIPGLARKASAIILGSGGLGTGERLEHTFATLDAYVAIGGNWIDAARIYGNPPGDVEKAMNEREDQLKCAGFITTADMLFPDMEDEMSFENFFSLIGVDDYEYLSGDEVITGEGWLSFMYDGMEVMVNTNEAAPGGGWEFTGAEFVNGNAPVSIADPELSNANQDLADAVMFH